ncbi:MAG TPA: hypothetical protein PLZ57_07600 [Pseudobdellovibrionaceae bacterium]|nr:hypothetical protein [Pseudobdellovibrionaceae bacterium]
MLQDDGESRRAFLRSSSLFLKTSALGLATFSMSAAKARSAREAWPPRRPGRAPSVTPSIAASTAPRVTGFFPILQGATSATETQLHVLTPTDATCKYVVIDAAGARREFWATRRRGVAASGWLSDHVWIDGLQAGASCRLEIERVDQAGVRSGVLDRREFKTLATSPAAPLRTALISCMNDRYVNDQGAMWAAVAESEPELMIFNGDLCYVDQRSSGTIDGMWDRHVTTRRMLDVFRWNKLVPTLVNWDDHDLAENDSNVRNPRLKPAGEFFDAMFGFDDVQGLTRSPGRSFAMEIGGLKFLMLDGRSALDARAGRVFSEDDLLWAEREIQSATRPLVLVCGQQFFGDYLIGAESVERYARSQLQRLMQAGQQSNAPMVLVSGDVHFSEIMRLESSLMGYETLEITSSAIHSRTFVGQQYRSSNPRRLESTSRNNFCLTTWTPSADGREVSLELRCLGRDQTEYFQFKDRIRR